MGEVSPKIAWCSLPPGLPPVKNLIRLLYEMEKLVEFKRIFCRQNLPWLHYMQRVTHVLRPSRRWP